MASATKEKTLGRIYRETIKEILEKDIKGSPNLFIAHYQGLKASEMTELRKELKKIDAHISIVLNRLTRPVLEKLKLKELSDSVDGPTAFIFSKDDPVTVSRSLMNFSKEHDKLNISLAYVEERVLVKEAIKELSSLPSREVLLAWVIGGIKAPISGLHNVLSGTLRKLVLVFDAIAKNKKDEAPAKAEEKAPQNPEEAKATEEAIQAPQEAPKPEEQKNQADQEPPEQRSTDEQGKTNSEDNK